MEKLEVRLVGILAEEREVAEELPTALARKKWVMPEFKKHSFREILGTGRTRRTKGGGMKPQSWDQGPRINFHSASRVWAEGTVSPHVKGSDAMLNPKAERGSFQSSVARHFGSSIHGRPAISRVGS